MRSFGNFVGIVIILLMMLLSASAIGADGSFALTATKVYTAPDAAPIEDGVVLVRDGKIAAVGARTQVVVLEGTASSQCSGGIVAAGFQNSHVHLLGEAFYHAQRQSADVLSAEIERMLTRYGYTTVVDTASQIENTTTIRRRIESGEIKGPRILTVGAAVFPPNGLPIYISHLPEEFLDSMSLPESAAEAARMVRQNTASGADATKLFVATPQADNSLKRMTTEIALAAAEEAHRLGKLVMVHPTDIEGVRTALAANADILVHTTLGEESPWPGDVLKDLLARNVAIAPTFKLLGDELKKQRVPSDVATQVIAATIEHFKPFVTAGGTVIFGTDVGYMTDYDPTDEYVLLQRAGLSPMQILASLTTLPAKIWKEEEQRGRISAGMDADLVVLRSDPSTDVRNFADVRCSIRAGESIYERDDTAVEGDPIRSE